MNGIVGSEVRSVGRGMRKDKIFSSATGRTNYSDGETRVKQSLEIIFSTFFNEVPMIPVLGSDIPYLVFEPLDESTRDEAEMYVTEAINKLEPRIQLNQISIVVDEELHQMHITGDYKYTNTNIEGEFDYSLDFERGGDDSE